MIQNIQIQLKKHHIYNMILMKNISLMIHLLYPTKWSCKRYNVFTGPSVFQWVRPSALVFFNLDFLPYIDKQFVSITALKPLHGRQCQHLWIVIQWKLEIILKHWTNANIYKSISCNLSLRIYVLELVKITPPYMLSALEFFF